MDRSDRIIMWLSIFVLSAVLLVLSFLGAPAKADSFTSPQGVPVPVATSSAAESSRVLKSSAGYIHGLSVTSGAVDGYVMLFDATDVPADGAVTPKYCYKLPATRTLGLSWEGYPAPFLTGIAVAFSSTGCFTKTASATAFFSAQVL